VQLEKNVDPNFDRVNFESGQYGLRLMEPCEEVVAMDRFGVRGGMFNNLYFYNQKRHSCVAEHVFNTRLMNITCKYVQNYGYEDRTALVLGPGRDGRASRDVQFDAVFVNGDRSSAKLRHGMVLNGDRVQVTGGSVRRTDGTGIVIEGGMGTMITGTSVAYSGEHGIEIRDEATEVAVSSVSVTETQGYGVHVDGEASVVGVRGTRTQQGEVGGNGTVAGVVGEKGTAAKSGKSDQRPANPAVGTTYFDTTLGKPLWWNADHWVDSDGTRVSQ